MVSFFVVPLALIGFAVSWYIYYKKNRGEKLVCVIGEDCDNVLNSKYAKLFGVPNEVLGMLYYAAVIMLAVAFYFGVDAVAGFSLHSILIITASVASIFSVFLIGVQVFVLKDWCEYCLVSSGVSIAILVAELFF